MPSEFSKNPILNSPYEVPKLHWQLNEKHQPTGIQNPDRRGSVYFVPVPEARRRRQQEAPQPELGLEDTTKENPIVNHIRKQVKEWREKQADDWNVGYVTKKLLLHWRRNDITPRPFFCQLEAVETLIWLNEIAPKIVAGEKILDELKEANAEANPNLFRIACKMATGSGKTMVMAMMIAYHTLNRARHPKSANFTNNFLIITPGITIKDRLRVLYPSDPESYFTKGNIVPPEFRTDIQRAKVVITNYHAFKARETIKISKNEREVLQGHSETPLSTLETDGQMLDRVCKELLYTGDVLVINDEAHHCYRHKQTDNATTGMTGEEKAEAKQNNEAARLWINGIEKLQQKVKLRAVYDLSATPFFLRGSGYPEGNLFPWVVSDFSLMDAIESGIVKLPRVPVDDAAMDELPIYRNIYKKISHQLPKKGRRKQGHMDPQDLPAELVGAMETLYANYAKTAKAWADNGIKLPPVFIVVCNNTATSKLVYDYISGYAIDDSDRWKLGRFKLFRNTDDSGKPLARMRTLLIDSQQLESGESMSDEFKKVAAVEIDNFKRERFHRSQGQNNKDITDEELLREVMNTIGKQGKLGEQVRCVVSVSMLTEGWDTNNVTHILGIRAFGTQLLCEQVVGRGLRRFSYNNFDEEGLLKPEYASVFGVPFHFAPSTSIAPPPPPEPHTRIHAVRDRAHLTITFPHVRAYSVKIQGDYLTPNFTENSLMPIDPDEAPPWVETSAIVGPGEKMSLDEALQHRENEVVFSLAAETTRLFAEKGEANVAARFRDLVPIARHWIKNYLTCHGETSPNYLMLEIYKREAAKRIHRACIPQPSDKETLIPVVEKYNPSGSTQHVNFLTRKKKLVETNPENCHINLAICDSDWEMNFCRLLNNETGVHTWVRNDGLGFEIPYTYRGRHHLYRPDYIVQIDDGLGKDDLLNLIVEIKGERDDSDRVKADTAEKQWVPAVNNDGRWGRWKFAEIKDISTAREIMDDILHHSGNIT
ncbi:MAG: DEAD/DEAH box helicase family protein [Proteobacteria bacterium]|nr:DEAD/DEAH box helicase family protein [Pseudomonadota bacterium]